MPSSTARPSTWWKAGMCVASSSSVRNTRPDRRDVDRHAALEQGAGLHRRGVGAQHEAALGRVDVEGVLHLPRRVVGVEVQGVEVEPLGLDLGPLGDLPAHADEQVGDALAHQLDRVARGPAGGGRSGSVTSTASSVRMRSSRSASSSAWRAVNAWATRASGLADALAGLGLGARRQGADLAVGQGQGAPVALVGAAGGLQLVEVGRRGGGGERLGDGGVDRLGVEHGDLHGVVAGVGSRHGVHFGRGWGAPESRWGRAGDGGGLAPGRRCGRLLRRGCRAAAGAQRARPTGPEGPVNRRAATVTPPA